MEPKAECILVLIGATPEGKKELVGFHVGRRESAQSWRELLVELKARGLAVAPETAVGDGALGFWKALDEVFPGTRHQRCWVHKVSNVLNKFPKSMAPAVKSDLRDIWQAETRAAAEAGHLRREVRDQVRQCRRVPGQGRRGAPGGGVSGALCIGHRPGSTLTALSPASGRSAPRT
jgi:transposase-like protein